MANIRVPNQHVDDVRNYLAYLQSGGDPSFGTTLENSELIGYLFTDPQYISAFSLGCLGAWSIGLMFGHVFKYMAKLRV